MNIKHLITNEIGIDLPNCENLILESISADKGDYCLPCFAFAKELHKSPMDIANQIATSIKCDGIIEKVEVVAGYVNFFLNKAKLSQKIIDNFNKDDLFLTDGQGKVVCIDYGSPNLAKYLHIGHLKTLIVGESLARLFTQCGYQVKRLNFVGDYGTPFGKIIGGLLKWGSLEEVRTRGNDALQDYYIKFNQMEEQDESYTQLARDIFKKLEDKDPELYPIYKEILEIGLKDCIQMFTTLGVTFDDYRGELYYSENVPQVLKILSDHNLITESQGAKIVDLTPFDMTPAVIEKSDGTSLYITRDLSAVMQRYNDYHFDKAIYITGLEQKLHFKQWFKIIDLLGFDYADKLEHIGYGRFSVPDGKISSRRGKQAILKDLLSTALEKANEVIKGRTFEIENPQDVAMKVARTVLNYNVLKVEIAKDSVFDVEKAFSFDGETAPYMQYTHTRLQSIMRKYVAEDVVADYSSFDTLAFELVKDINDFANTIRLSLEKRDPSLIGKKLMDMCKTFNKFYTNTKVLDGNSNTTKAKINLVNALKQTFDVGFNLICADTLQEM